MWPFSKKPTETSVPQSQPQGYRVSRSDSWQNRMTGMGVGDYDKRMSTSFESVTQLTEDELNSLCRGEGLGGRIIDVLTEDLMRKPFTITGDVDNKLTKELKKINGLAKISELNRWALQHGGSIGVIGIDDSGYLDEPVNEANIRAITHIHVFDRWRVQWFSSEMYTNPSHPKYGTPQWYTIYPITTGVVPYSQNYLDKTIKTPLREQYANSGRTQPTVGVFRVHESRIMRHEGKLLPLRERVKNHMWNDSYLQGCYERLRGLGEAYAGLEIVLSEFMQGTLTIEGLAGQLASGNEAILFSRMRMLRESKHSLNTIMLDTLEEYKREFANVAGLPQVVSKLETGLCAVTGIPVTRLMTESPGGLNASGDNSMLMYYDKISAMQPPTMQEPIEKLVRYIMLSKGSAFGGVELKDWEVEFPNLYELTEAEQATLELNTAQKDQIYITTGVLTPEEVTLSRYSGNKFSTNTVLSKERDENGKLPEPEPTAEELMAHELQMKALQNKAGVPS